MFAFPFACVGIGAFCYACYSIYRWEKACSWPTVQATVLSAELETHSDSDGTTYKAVATYEYEFDGRRFTSDRVSLGGGSDNIGSFQKSLARRLKKHKANGEPIDCFVDPSNPQDSLLDRTLRSEMFAFMNIFATIFGSVGLGIIAGSRLVLKQSKSEAKLRAKHPEEPWKWRQDWLDGSVFPSRTFHRVFALVAVWWNIAALPSWCIGIYQLLFGDVWALIALIFPAIGIILGLILFRNLLAARRGPVSFEMSKHGVVGGPFSGVLHVPFASKVPQGVKAELVCVRRISRGEDSQETIMNHQEAIFAKDLAEHDNTMAVLPIVFSVPFNAPPTDMGEQETADTWYLRVRSGSPKISEEFEVPVFKTDESRPDFKLDESVAESYQLEGSNEEAREDILESIGVKVAENSIGFQEVTFPMFRSPMGSAILIAFTLGFWAVAVFLLIQSMLVFFGFVVLFALLISYVTLDSVFYSSVVTQELHGLRVQGGIFGIGAAKSVPREKITNLELINSGQVNEHRIYTIELHTEDGQKLSLAKNIVGKTNAKVVRERIRSMIERPS